MARVVEAIDPSGVTYAAKFVPKKPGASREMLLSEVGDARNVIPVVDSGEVNDEYVFLMPLADKSLRDHLDQQVPLSQSDALDILIDIAATLTDLDGRVVHRDLKPENILLLNGHWCLMDFGIARYAEAATDPDSTRRDFRTAAYAAPEQWLGERATGSTDVYAFGVIAYEILEGKPPFQGDRYELRDHHLHTDPPEPTTVGPVLAALVQECMFKTQESRPRAANVLAMLERARESAIDDRWQALSLANQTEVGRRAARDAEEARTRTEYERRVKVYTDGLAAWARISQRFQGLIDEYLPTAEVIVRPDKHWHVELNGAKFGLSYPALNSTKPLAVAFDVIASSTLSVNLPELKVNNPGWRGRSHSLYFADMEVADNFGWYETAFMNNPLYHGGFDAQQEPFALTSFDEEWQTVFTQTSTGLRQAAWPLTRVDPGDCDDFVQRWLEWFAAAIRGALGRPATMPERTVSLNWRRGSE